MMACSRSVTSTSSPPTPGREPTAPAEREETHRPHLIAIRVTRRAHTHQGAHDGPALGGDCAQYPLVLTAVGGDHDLFHPPTEVLLDGEAVHVGERLVEVDVSQLLVEHDQADGAGLEEGVEEGQVGLDPIEFVAAARQGHDHRTAPGAGHGEDPETAVEDRAVQVPCRQSAAPVPQGAAPLRQPDRSVRGALGRIREEDAGGFGQHRRGVVPEEVLRAGPPVADPVVLVDAEDGDGHVFQQRPGLGPERTRSLLAPRPI